MDNKLFLFILQNQQKWAYEFRKSKDERKLKKSRAEKMRAKLAKLQAL